MLLEMKYTRFPERFNLVGRPFRQDLEGYGEVSLRSLPAVTIHTGRTWFRRKPVQEIEHDIYSQIQTLGLTGDVKGAVETASGKVLKAWGAGRTRLTAVENAPVLATAIILGFAVNPGLGVAVGALAVLRQGKDMLRARKLTKTGDKLTERGKETFMSQRRGNR